MNPARMADVAKRAAVSVTTVSHVLNDTRRVNDGTRRRVLQAVAELGYQPNMLARSLKTQRTFTIGLLLSDIQNPFFTTVVRGVEDVALKRGYHVFLCNTDEDPAREDEYLHELAKKRVDGLIVASAAPRDSSRQLSSQDLPIVLMDREISGVDADAIRVDNREGMRLIAKHLVSLGHRRIGLISGPLDKVSGLERYEGLRDALAALGLELEKSLVWFGDFKLESGRDAARRLAERAERPTALVVANNQMTLGALLGIGELGLRIPHHLSVVGFDDMEWAPLVNPPLTTVAQPAYELGVGAVRMLLDRIEGETGGGSRHVFLEPRLIVRASTAPTTADEPRATSGGD